MDGHARPRRPGFLLWLRFAMIGSLPPAYSTWVLHDVSCSTWFARYTARVLVKLAVPTIAVVLLVPTNGSIRALTAMTTSMCALLLMGIISSDVTERQAQRAGYPWGTASKQRQSRSEQDQREHVAAYRARRAERRQ